MKRGGVRAEREAGSIVFRTPLTPYSRRLSNPHRPMHPSTYVPVPPFPQNNNKQPLPSHPPPRQVLMRLKNVRHLDARLSGIVDSAYTQARAADRAWARRKRKPPMQVGAVGYWSPRPHPPADWLAGVEL